MPFVHLIHFMIVRCILLLKHPYVHRYLFETIRLNCLGREIQKRHCVTIKPAPFLEFRYLNELNTQTKGC